MNIIQLELAKLNKEKNALTRKSKNLLRFFNSRNYNVLSTKHKNLLNKQYYVMSEYKNILDARIALLKEQINNQPTYFWLGAESQSNQQPETENESSTFWSMHTYP